LKKPEVFPNAPIVEALLDIRVRLAEDLDIQDLEKIHEVIKEDFPTKQEQQFLKGNIHFSSSEPPVSETTTSGVIGYLFKSSQEDKVVQSRVDGFTFNKLKPYENWKSFSDEAKKFWNSYCQATPPQQILRVALRYINRIEIPLPIEDFSEYILTNPQIAPGLPQSLSSFLMRLELPHPETDSRAIITQTMDSPTKSNKLPLILDIDVIRDLQDIKDTKRIWSIFEELRHFKDEIFDKSLTDKAKELFR